MVRETRHLWVGNLPENIREERIRDHFKRYGRVQSVKLFSRKGGAECDGSGLVICGTTGTCATVSFMDIKSASKAHNSEHKLDEHLLTTEYHEPAPISATPAVSAVPSSVSTGSSPVAQATSSTLRHPPPYSSPRITYGPEDITTFDSRSSHFFERRDGTESYVRRPPAAYVVSPSESLRGRTRERDRLYRNGPTHYTPILESVVARTPPTHHRAVTTTGWSSFETTSCSRYPSSVVTTPEILSYQEDRRESPVIIVHKKHPKSRRKCRVMRRCGSNGSGSVSNNSDSSRSRSHSSSSSSHSRSSSSSSDSSSAAISERSCSTHSHHGSLKSTVTVHSTISTPLTNCSPVVHTDDRRPLAICVRNLPARSSDSSLKDGLYHEYKKYGRVTSVKVLGQGASRYAIVCFKKADDVEKALQVSHDKLFFGSKIEVTIYHGFDVEDNEFKPIEAELDEYHPKATRTLFIGNLEKDVTVDDLRNTFQKFGEIIDIDIKKQGTTCYAFCQYCDISSVVKAMHVMDGEYLGNNKINLGYGKSLATNCLWVAGVADCVTEKQLIGSFSQFGHVTHVHINRSQGKALVFFQQITHAQAALSQMRGYVLKNRRLMADYASVECQENFYESYEKSKLVATAYENNCQDSPRSTGSTRGLDTPVSTTSSNSGNISKHSLNSANNSNNSNNNSTNNNTKLHPRIPHSSSSSRTTPTRQPIPQTPSSNSASPIVNNTPSPSPSTSSRSTPHPQQTSRFDYSSTSDGHSDKLLSRSLEDLNLNIGSSEKPLSNPQDDVTLQKERVSLLEQLNDYSSSEEEEVEEELTSLKQQNALRRQRSTSREESRQRSTSREESRPGTPLCDERPENILAHYESRRAAKEKNVNNTPLSLPLPSFANKVPRSMSPCDRSSKSPHQSKPQSRPFDSVRNTSLNCIRQPSSPHIKDKSSILDMKLSNITSFETLTETLKAPWIEQLKSLDEKYEKWSGSRSRALMGKLDTSSVQIKHKLPDVNAIGRQRSEICQTVLSRKSVFDDHFKRLETISDQQPTTDFIPPRLSVSNTTRSHSISVANPLPNLCSKPVTPPTPPLPTTSTLNSVSSSVIKGLQYPFPSHPPLKSASSLTKLGMPFLSIPKPSLPDSVQTVLTVPSSMPGSNSRSALLLRNNSVEKLTDLPKNSLPITTCRDSLNRLDAVCSDMKKDVLCSPVSSRRNSVDSIGRKSTDDEYTERREIDLRKLEPRTSLVNQVDVKTKFNNSFTTCRVSATEKENSVLDKRKESYDQTECSNAVSVIIHTSQRDKLSKSLEDISDINRVDINIRRSSIESSSVKENRLNINRLNEEVKSEKSFTETLNHQKKIKMNDARPELKSQPHKIKDVLSKHDNKIVKLESNYHDKCESRINKQVPFNHIDESKNVDQKKDERIPQQDVKSDNLNVGERGEGIDLKCNVIEDDEEDDDDDGDDPNDVDEGKIVTEKNKIIETVFHIKHEKKKPADGKSETNDDKCKIAEKKKNCETVTVQLKELEFKRDQIDDAKLKKECLKTKEFNMFENKLSEKKKNNFLVERCKSDERDLEDNTLQNAAMKHKDNEVKEMELSEHNTEKAKLFEKKKEKQHIENRPKESEKRKSEENRSEKKSESLNKVEVKKENLCKLKESEKDLIKEKKKEKVSGQPENGKIKHDFKRYKEVEDQKTKQSNTEKEVNTESTDIEKNNEFKILSSRNKFQLESFSKSSDQKDTSKERKNSSSSSSLSDSILPCKSKLSSYDSLESNNDEKSKHEISNNTESKKLDKPKSNCNVTTVDTNSGKEEKKGSDSSRGKKSEKLSSSTNGKRSKKSKKRKTLSDSSTDSEFESFDESKFNKKNHSIFDVVLDEPAYISMYDKVKARSTKNLQKQEEEKRQEKLKEKFSQLKQSRVKREEKKRSTSYDDDTDAERTVSRKGNKLILDSSDEEHSGNDKVKLPVRSDSSDEERQRKKKAGSDIEEELKSKLKKVSRRSLNGKNREKSKHVLTDTSEDEIKMKLKREQQFVLMSEAKRKFKKDMSKISKHKSNHKNEPRKKAQSDLSGEDNRRRGLPKSFYESRINADKMYSDFSDNEVKTKSDKLFSDVDQPKESFEDHLTTKCKTKLKNNLKIMIDNGELNKMNKVNADDLKNKMRLLSDVSEEESIRPRKIESKSRMKKADFIDNSRVKQELLSDTSENESVLSCRFPKVKPNIFTDDSEVDEKMKSEEKNDDDLFFSLSEIHHEYTKSDKSSQPENVMSCRFSKVKCNIYTDDSESDVQMKREEKNDDLFLNLSETHKGYNKSENSSPPPLIDPMVYDIHEFQKKKSHKKKQKRQKSREHSIERIKKHSKKERRKSMHSDIDEECKEKEHRIKQKKKKKNRNKVKSIENIEEDIFGSMSEDSETALNDSRKISKLSVSDVYDADSDSSNKDVRENENIAVDMPSFPKTNAVDLETARMKPVENTSNYESYLDHIKSKKKKRKKSKEEKCSKHHHHHHHHNHHHTKQDMTERTDLPVAPLSPLSPASLPPPLTLPSLEQSVSSVTNKSHSSDLDWLEENPKTEKPQLNEGVDIVTTSIVEEKAQEEKSVESVHEKVVTSISNCTEGKSDEENIHDRAVKSIAAESIHEQAVLSISSVLVATESKPSIEPMVRPTEEKLKITSTVDDKTGITISQEETEDAVAAILGDSSEFGFSDCFQDDSLKSNSEPEIPGNLNSDGLQKSKDLSVSLGETISTNDSFVSVKDITESNASESVTDNKSVLLTGDTDTSTDDSLFTTPREHSSDFDKSISSCSESVHDSNILTEDTKYESTLAYSAIEEGKDVKSLNETEESIGNLNIPTSENVTCSLEVRVEDICKSETRNLLEIRISDLQKSDIALSRNLEVCIPDICESHAFQEIIEKVESSPSEKTPGTPSQVENLSETLLIQNNASEVLNADKNEQTILETKHSRQKCNTPKPYDDNKSDTAFKPADTYSLNKVANSFHPSSKGEHQIAEKPPGNPTMKTELPVYVTNETTFSSENISSTYENITVVKPKLNDAIQCNDRCSLDILELKGLKPDEHFLSLNNITSSSVDESSEDNKTSESNVDMKFEATFDVTTEKDVVLETCPPNIISATFVDTVAIASATVVTDSSKFEPCKKELLPKLSEILEFKSATDHTYNSKTRKRSADGTAAVDISKHVKDKPCALEYVTEEFHKTVIKKSMNDDVVTGELPRKDEVQKPASVLDSVPMLSVPVHAERIERNLDRQIEIDALKQKLPMPAQQNMELIDRKELEHDTCEVNEANKENIVKTIKNQENLVEVNDDAKLNVIIRNKDRNDSFSSNDTSLLESNEDASEPVDIIVTNENTGNKLNDHSYNAKRGRRRKATASCGVVTRRGKHTNVSRETEEVTNFKVKKSSTDIYEFKEDSEEEVKRPRLILTIKSPVEPPPSAPPSSLPVSQLSSSVVEAPVISEIKTSPPVVAGVSIPTTPTSAKAMSAYTRKSRRLQEKESGFRNAVDDTIDEVVKTLQNSRPTRRTTRIAAAAAAAIITTVHESTRKNARSTKKQATKMEISPPVVESQPMIDDHNDFPHSPISTNTVSPCMGIPSSPIATQICAEPTNLIDPVSGLLIPMKEAEEGQYVPVRTDLNQSRKTPDYPPEKKPRLEDVIEESAISLVKSEPIVKLDSSPVTITVSSSSITSVIASVANQSPVIKCATVVSSIPSKVLEVSSIPVIHASPPQQSPTLCPVDDGPISLIKTTTHSIITPAAAMKSHSAGFSQSFPTLGYSQKQPATKLLSSKTVTPQPRVLTPITPKAHILQALGSENESHSNDEVPYPPQYSSPLIHGAVASPPLCSPKVSPQPIVIGANNTRVAYSVKNVLPLEPLKIDPAAGYYYLPSTSPQSRSTLPVQSSSPQSRVVHSTPPIATGLLPPHSAVQPSHYVQPQFMYQPYIQEPSLTPYPQIAGPPSSQTSASSAVTAKIVNDRDIIDGLQPAVTLSIVPSPPPLELRKKTSPHGHLSDSHLITSPFVQNNRPYYYEEPLQPHRAVHSRLRVMSTAPYASKVSTQGEPVEVFLPMQSRLLETPTGHRFSRLVPPLHDDDIKEDAEHIEEDVGVRSYIDGGYTRQRPIMQDGRVLLENELDYSRRSNVKLCDSAVPRSRDSSPSQMDSPPLGDSPPQGNLDGTVLVQMYPIIWQGLMALKNDQAAVQMHVVSGNTSVAYDALPKLQDGYQPLLRIAQRMRLEQAQLDGVNRKMEIKDEHCTILGLPCGKNQEDVVQQATNLESCIIPYLQQKKAAGIINTAAPGTQQAAFVVHVFPPCEFADNVLLNAAPDLYRKVQETAYLVCIIVTV